MVRISFWTILFLVALRLTIGWHFFFEGYHKIETHEIGTIPTNKPWSSEGYFRAAEGPARKPIIDFIGDPDQELLAKLTVKEEADKPVDDPGRLPEPLANEWKNYFDRFVAYYKIDEVRKDQAKKKFNEIQKDAIRWLINYHEVDLEKKISKWHGVKTVKITPPNGGPPHEIDVTTPYRIAEYRWKLEQLRGILTEKLPTFGQNVDDTIPAKRAELATIRREFEKELEGYTTRIKDDLAAILYSGVTGFDPKPVSKDLDKYVLSMLELAKTELATGKEEEGMPIALRDQWDAHFSFIKGFKPPDQQAEAEESLQAAKRRYVRYVLGRDEYTGEPRISDVAARLHKYREWLQKLPTLKEQATQKNEDAKIVVAYTEAEKEVTRLRSDFIADIQRHTNLMKAEVSRGIPEDLLKGYLPAEKSKKNVDTLDWATRWGLTIMGACIMIGFFTRTMCFLAAGFLITTQLLHPSLPYLPTSPMTEGFYLYINKNIIELLALLMLATTRSGKWIGLDALIGWIFSRRKGENG
jgi:uncharacterized membrane protein YphA (DoxX/SURF4 family)